MNGNDLPKNKGTVHNLEDFENSDLQKNGKIINYEPEPDSFLIDNPLVSPPKLKEIPKVKKCSFFLLWKFILFCQNVLFAYASFLMGLVYNNNLFCL